MSLATTKLIVEYSTNKDMISRALEKTLEKYIPYNFISLNPSMYWIKKIMDCYNIQMNKLVSSTKTNTQLSFISQLKSNYLWEVQQFNIKVCIMLTLLNMTEDLILLFKILI